jgi:hypothetical protein
MVTDKTIKTGFDGFDGSRLAESPKIEAEALDQEPARVGASLAWHGRAVAHKPHTIDPQTGIWPISEWGSACGRGFVCNPRFGAGPVIRRTDRKTTRKWRKLDLKGSDETR